MKKKEEARKCEEMEALIAEEGFISDPDAFFVLTP
jgi:hypothetical protein